LCGRRSALDDATSEGTLLDEGLPAMKHSHSRLLFTLAAGSAGIVAGCAAAHDDEDDEGGPMGLVSTVATPDDGAYDAGVVAAIDAGVVIRDASVWPQGVVLAPRDAQVLPVGLPPSYAGGFVTRPPATIDAGSYAGGFMTQPPATIDAGIVTAADTGIAPGTTVAPEPCRPFGSGAGICATLPGIIIRHERDEDGAELPIGIVLRSESP
jgi:hypothetical protein